VHAFWGEINSVIAYLRNAASFCQLGGGRDRCELTPAQFLTPRVPFSPAAARRTVVVADVFDVVHSTGIIHWDVKTANLLITCRDEPKVLDFGLAASVIAGINGSAVENQLTLTNVPQLTGPGTVVGTISYMTLCEMNPFAVLLPKMNLPNQ